MLMTTNVETSEHLALRETGLVFLRTLGGPHVSFICHIALGLNLVYTLNHSDLNCLGGNKERLGSR